MEVVSSSLFERVIVIIDTCLVVSKGSRPSSKGSQVSVISVDPMEVIWCRPTILLLINSTIMIVLLIALPMALNTISLEPLS